MQAGLVAAFSKAKKRLPTSDPQALALQGGFEWDTEKQIFSFRSLGEGYTISFPEGYVQKADGRQAVPKFALLSLHYLLSKPTPSKGTWISFKELPGGTLYQAPFQGRTIGRLFAGFNDAKLEGLSQACEQLKGNKIPGGDMTFQFQLFPYVPLNLICWKGDEEFPPSGNILFDANSNDFLTTEDYAVLGEYLVEELLKYLPK